MFALSTEENPDCLILYVCPERVYNCKAEFRVGRTAAACLSLIDNFDDVVVWLLIILILKHKGHVL